MIQIDGNQVPRIIAYASKSLTEVERRYYQTEREALGIVWAVEKFHTYLFGASFEIVTDCKVLEKLFLPSSKPCLRIERWVLRLQAYSFKVIHRPGKSNLADSLSRLAVVDDHSDASQETNLIMYVREMAPSAIPLSEIESVSTEDMEIEEVKNALQSGHWDKVSEAFRRVKSEICQVGELLVRGSRVIIPKVLQARVIDLGHTGHPGMVAMKVRMRSKVWFPNMDKMIEQNVKSCLGCLMTSSQDPPDPLSIRPMPDAPWLDIAIDFKDALPNGNSLLVAIDYFSRFVQVAEMEKTETAHTITALKFMFAYTGLPKSITADNGPQFASKEFKDFCLRENIHLKSTTPYYPSMNGEVERFNRNIKKRLQISHVEGTNWRNDLADYLLSYNNMVHSTTGVSPASLMFGRELRDKLPSLDQMSPALLHEDIINNDLCMKEKRKEYADTKRRARFNDIKEGDMVLSKNQTKDSVLQTNFGPERFKVVRKKGTEVLIESNDRNKQYRRHASHLKKVTDGSNEILFEEREESDVGKEKAPEQEEGQRPTRQVRKPNHLKDYI